MLVAFPARKGRLHDGTRRRAGAADRETALRFRQPRSASQQRDRPKDSGNPSKRPPPTSRRDELQGRSEAWLRDRRGVALKHPRGNRGAGGRRLHYRTERNRPGEGCRFAAATLRADPQRARSSSSTRNSGFAPEPWGSRLTVYDARGPLLAASRLGPRDDAPERGRRKIGSAFSEASPAKAPELRAKALERGDFIIGPSGVNPGSGTVSWPRPGVQIPSALDHLLRRVMHRQRFTTLRTRALGFSPDGIRYLRTATHRVTPRRNVPDSIYKAVFCLLLQSTVIYSLVRYHGK